MKNIRAFVFMIFTLVTLLVFVVCNTTAPKATFAKTVTAKPATTKTTNWWDKFGEPQYGGTIRTGVIKLANTSFDPYTAVGGDSEIGSLFLYETLFWLDWTLDRKIWPYQGSFLPEMYAKGRLAESWEQTDPTTVTIHIRHGVHWHNKPPVNGREFVASDVVAHYDRVMGWGKYTEPSPTMSRDFMGVLESVSAPDDYTVVFKFKSYNSGMLVMTDLNFKNRIEAPETVTNGPITEWNDAVGTGPWILTDYINGSSLTFSRNPDYWGYDERNPKNKLPYADELKLLQIEDESTRLAAIRAGQVDLISFMGMQQGISWQKAQALTKTNPEIRQLKAPSGEYIVIMNCEHAPFTDIRVRKAMQMSINRPEIAKAYYGGTADGIPCGQVPPSYQGWYPPYNKWSQELKDEYSYNPTKAKQLLAEAAADGVFKSNTLGGFDTNCISAAAGDLQLLQIIQSYLKDIGINMEIKTIDQTVMLPMLMKGQNDQLYFAPLGALAMTPSFLCSLRFSKSPINFAHCNDPVYDDYFMKFRNAQTIDEARQILYDQEMRLLTQHWSVYLCPYNTYSISQPYLKGYSGETHVHAFAGLFARLWIDQSLKK